MIKKYPYIGNPLGFKLPEKKPVVHPIINQWDDFTEDDKTILQDIKNTIISNIGDCQVKVFGSRIKGNWTEESDYDIVVFGKISGENRKKLLTATYNVPVDIKFFAGDTDPFFAVEIK